MDQETFLQEYKDEARCVDQINIKSETDRDNIKTRIKMIKKLYRKLQHKKFVRMMIVDLHWDIINTTVVASATGWTDGVTNHLENNGNLIRKYERRLKWL